MTNFLAPPIEVVLLYLAMLGVVAYLGWRILGLFRRRMANARVNAARRAELAALDDRLTSLEDATDYLGDALRVPPPPPPRLASPGVSRGE